MALTKIPSSLLDTSGGFDLQGNITLGDNERIQFGDGTDFEIYSDGGSNNYLISNNGALILRNLGDDKDIYLQSDDGSGGFTSYIHAKGSTGEVILKHYGSNKIATSSTGATVTGVLTATSVNTGQGDYELYAMDQNVRTTDSPEFAAATINGTLTVTGDLDITGDINSYNVTDLDVTDKTITLGAGQTEANSGGSGIIIDGSSASILWDETNTEFDINNSINVTGDNKAVLVSSADQDKIAFLGPRGSSGDSADEGLFYLRDGSTIAAQINSNGISYFNGGNVGIGTDNPNQLLHLDNSASSSDSAGIRIISGTAGNARILFGDPDYGSRGRLIYSNSDDSMQFWGADSTTSAERMRIKSNGNVGIGDTDPSRKLNLLNQSGDTLMKIQTNAEGYAGIDYANSAQLWYAGLRTDVGNGWAIKDETNTNIFFQVRPSSGKVGIGLNTDSPRKVLHVKGNESGAQVVEIEQDNNAGIAGMHFSFNDTTVAHLGMGGASYTGNSEWTDKFFIGTISDKAVVISQNDIAAMTIDTDQNVIIGSGHNSTTPNHAIIKAAAASGFNNTGGDLRLYGGTSTGDNAGGEIEFYTGAAASSGTQANNPTVRMTIDSSGDITVNNGILKGMSHLEIKNDYGTDDTSTSPRLFSPASGTLAFSANGGERMRITSAGRISLSDSEGIKLSAKTSSMYALDGALSYYGTGNGVYLNGAGSNGWLRLNASGVSNNRTAIDLYGQNQGDMIQFRAGDDDVMRMKDGGLVEFRKTSSRIASFGLSDANDKYITFYNSSGNFDLGTHTSNRHYLYGSGDIPISFFTNAVERATIDDKGIKQYNRFVSGTILPTAFVGCDSWYDLSGRYSTVVTSGNDLTSCTDASGEGRSTLIKNTVATGPNNNATLEQFPSGVYGFRFDQSSYITGTSHTSGYVPPTGTNARTLWCIIYNFREIGGEPINHFLHYGTNTTSQAFGIVFTTSSNEFGQHTWAGSGQEVDADTDIAGGFTDNGTTPRDVYVLFSSYDGGTGETRVYRGGMEGVSATGSISINTGAGYALHVGSRINSDNGDENCDAVIGEFGAFSRRLTTKEMDLLAHSLLLRWS